MTDLGLITHYLSIKVTGINDSIIIMQRTYINQFSASYQISNYNTTFTPMVKDLSLAITAKDFTPTQADIIAYRQFTRTV